MKSDSLTIHAMSLDALAAALKDKYSECSEVVSQSGDSRLIVIEKYYFRVNSNALGVVLIEATRGGEFLVNIIAGGGRSGMLGLDYGAENQFVEEIKKILLNAEETTTKGRDKGEYNTSSPASQRCIVCHQSFNKGDALLDCPSCGGKAHSIHMLEWLRTRDYCPACHAHITESTLRPTRW